MEGNDENGDMEGLVRCSLHLKHPLVDLHRANLLPLDSQP